MATHTRTMADISRYANKTIRLSAFLAETKMPLFIDKLATQGTDSPTLSLMEALDKDINVTAEYLKDMSKILQTVNHEHCAPELEMETDDMRTLFPDAYDPKTQRLSLFGLELRKHKDYDLSRMDNRIVRETLFNGVFKDSSYDDFKNLLTHLRKLDKSPTPSIKSPLPERIAYMTTKAATSHMASFKKQVLALLEGYQNIRRSMDIKSQQMVDDRFYGGRAMLYGVTKASTYISKADGVLQVGSRHKKHPKALESIHALVKSLPFIRAVEIDHTSDIRKFRDMMHDLENMKLDCPRAFELKDRKLGNYRFSGAYATRSDQITFEKGVTIPDMEIIAYDQDSPSSLAHEIAHFMDPRENNEMRNRVVGHFYHKINQDIFKELGIGNTDYFLSDAEIFARLGEIGFLLNQYGIEKDETPAMLAKRVQGLEQQSPLTIQHRETTALINHIDEMNKNPDEIERINGVIQAIESLSPDALLPPADPIERQSQTFNRETLSQWVNLGEKLYELGYEEHDDYHDILAKSRTAAPKQEVGISSDPLFTLSLAQRRHNLTQVVQMSSLNDTVTNLDIDTYLQAGLDSGAFTKAQVDAHKEREFSVALTKPIETYMGTGSPFNQAIYFDMANWTSEELALVANYTHNMYFTPNPFADERAKKILNSRALKNVTWHEHQQKNKDIRRSQYRVSDRTLLAQAVGRIPPELLAEAYRVGAKEHLLADGEFTEAVVRNWTRIGRGGAKKLSNSVSIDVIEVQYDTLKALTEATLDINAPVDAALMQRMVVHLAERSDLPIPEDLHQQTVTQNIVAEHLGHQLTHSATYYGTDGQSLPTTMQMPGVYTFRISKDSARYGALATTLQAAMTVLSEHPVSASRPHPMPSTTLTGQLMQAASTLLTQAQMQPSLPELAGDYASACMEMTRAQAISQGDINLTGLISACGIDTILPLAANRARLLGEVDTLDDHVRIGLKEMRLSDSEISRLAESLRDMVDTQAIDSPLSRNALPPTRGIKDINSIASFIGEYARSPFFNGTKQKQMSYQQLRDIMPVTASLMRAEPQEASMSAMLPLSLYAQALKSAVGETKAEPALRDLVGGLTKEATPDIIETVKNTVSHYGEAREDRRVGVSASGVAIADPVSRMIEKTFITSSDEDILESVPTPYLIDAALKSAVVAAVHAVTSKTPLRGAARTGMSNTQLPGVEQRQAVLILEGESFESLRQDHARTLGQFATHHISAPEPNVSHQVRNEHYGRSEASELLNKKVSAQVESLSDTLITVAPDIAAPVMQAVTITASQTDYMSFDNIKENDVKSTWEQNAIHQMENLAQHLQVAAVMSNSMPGPDFLPLPKVESKEALPLTVDSPITPASPSEAPKHAEDSQPTAPILETGAQVPQHRPDNDDVPAAGKQSLSAQNQMRLW